MSSSSDETVFTLPILHIHEASIAAYSIFNPNEWTDISKQIIITCAAQLSLLTYEVSILPSVLKTSRETCQLRFLDLQNQWGKKPWDLESCHYLVEVPEFHLFVLAYFSTIKTFLDLLVQLITTEDVIIKKVHGFHKKGKDAGGELLYFLRTKARDSKKETASQLVKFLEKQKEIWINQVTTLRDNLVHPQKGIQQITYGLEIKARDSELVLINIVQPTIDGKDFYTYAHEILQQIQLFSKLFLVILKTD